MSQINAPRRSATLASVSTESYSSPLKYSLPETPASASMSAAHKPRAQPVSSRTDSSSVTDDDEVDDQFERAPPLKRAKSGKRASIEGAMGSNNQHWLGPFVDGTGQIRVVCADRMEFVVQRYYLQAASTRLVKLLAGEPLDEVDNFLGPALAFLPSTSTLTIGCPSADLASFLCILQCIPRRPGLTLDALKRIATLAKSLQAESVLRQISLLLRDEHAPSSPWHAFVFAAQLDDIQAARTALSHMGKDRFHAGLDLVHFTPTMVDGLQVPWICALVRAIANHPGSSKGARGVRDWAAISEGFEL